MIIGPDVSFWQDDNETPQQIDFVKMKANGAEFVIIRAGQNKWVDSDFAYNWKAAKAAGLPRGCYWFWDSRYEPVKQAELWVRTMGGDFGELPMFADFEEKYGGNFSGWKNYLAFVECLEDLTDKEIGIYTAYYYFHENVPAQAWERFGEYPLWVANYGVTTPKIPKAWKEWLFWQYTETGDGLAYGAESKGIDLNYFNGSSETFRARFDLEPEEEPEEPEKDVAHFLYTDGTWE